MAPGQLGFFMLPKEIRDEIYEQSMPMRVMPSLLHWIARGPLSRKQLREPYHPNGDTRLPAIANAFQDSRDYFLHTRQQVNILGKAFLFKNSRHVGYQTPVSKVYKPVVPMYFSWRSDVLSLCELAKCKEEELDQILGMKDGIATLLDDERVSIAFDRNLLVRDRASINAEEDGNWKSRAVRKLLHRVSNRKEWTYIVGAGRIPLPRTEEARKRFSVDQKTALVDCDDEDTMEWLLQCCDVFETQNHIKDALHQYSPKRRKDFQDKYDRDVMRVQQAWLESNDCFDPQGPVRWTNRLGQETGENTKDWDREDPIVKEWVGKMPAVKYCVRLELFHPDQWEPSPIDNQAEAEEAHESTDQQEHRKRIRLQECERLHRRIVKRGDCELYMRIMVLGQKEYVTRDRVWRPNAPPYWALNYDWKKRGTNEPIDTKVDLEWCVQQSEPL